LLITETRTVDFEKYNTQVQQQPKFEGKCVDLKGHIYDNSNARQADLYAKTTKEIAEYVGKEYSYSGDIRRLVTRLERPVIPEPTDPPDNAGYATQKRFESALRSYQNRIDGLEMNIDKLYSLVMEQCTSGCKNATAQSTETLIAEKNININRKVQRCYTFYVEEDEICYAIKVRACL
jgi:hypothetical protein